MASRMLDFVHPDYRKLVIERTRQQITEGKVVPVTEEKFIRLDGTAIDVEVTAAPIHFQDTLASLVIFRDITERKRAQALQEAVYRIAHCDRDNQVFERPVSANPWNYFVSDACRKLLYHSL